MRTLLRGRSAFERDLHDELRSHLEHRADDIVRSGVSPREARRRACVEFGGVERYAEAIRDDAGAAWRRLPESLWRDAMIGARRLAAAPLFTFFAVLSLALGLGVTTSVYSVVHSLLWKPIPLADPDHAVMITSPSRTRAGAPDWRAVLSFSDFDALRRSQTSLVSISASAYVSDTLATERVAEVALGEAVIGDYFAVIGLPMLAGRGLQPADDDPGMARVVVVNRRVVEASFAGREDVIGEVVRIAGQPFEIVGVAPETFDGLGGDEGRWTSFWIPHAQRPVSTGRASAPTSRSFAVLGRLPPDRALAEVHAEVATLASRLDRAEPTRIPEGQAGAGSRLARVWQARLATDVYASSTDLAGRAGLLILLLISMVLVVACTNIANLMLARGSMRAHELAIRASLGASRGRIVRELTVESGWIALGGGLLGFVVTQALLVAFAFDIPTNSGRAVRLDPRLNVPVLGAAAFLLLGSLLVFGLGPALRLTRGATRGGLEAGAALGLPPGRGPWPLVRWQVAIAVGFLLVSSVTARLVWDAARHDSGIDLDRLAVATVSFDRDRGQDEEAARRTIDLVLAAARQQPGVAAVAAATGLPFGQTRTPLVRLTPAESPFVDGARYPSALALMSTPDIFETVGVPILRGRPFDRRDVAGTRPVVVMSEFAAREVFGTADVVGRDLAIRQVGGRALTSRAEVVGVSQDTDVGSLMHRTTGLIFQPLAQSYWPGVAFYARTQGDVDSAAARLTTAIRQADPDLGLSSHGAARRLMAPGFVLLGIAATLTTALGLLALVLSLVGLHGVLSQSVAARTREMGLRVALGATARQVGSMALSQGLRPVAGGLMLGLLFSTLIRAGVTTLMEPVPIVDWFALAVVPIPILLAAAVACYLPARRAARVDPNVALRDL
jgi:predicted permease